MSLQERSQLLLLLLLTEKVIFVLKERITLVLYLFMHLLNLCFLPFSLAAVKDSEVPVAKSKPKISRKVLTSSTK